jgi:hypothetical protein
MPSYVLQLKKYCTIILVRNLDSINGACNRTMLIINYCSSHVSDATIENGPKACNRIFIPRINLTPLGGTDLPFKFNRLQFICGWNLQCPLINHKGKHWIIYVP